MAQMGIAPKARARRVGGRSDSGRPRLVLVPSPPAEPDAGTGLPPEAATGVPPEAPTGLPAERGAATALPAERETATGLPVERGAATLAEPSRRTVLRGSVRAGQLLPAFPAPARVGPQSRPTRPVSGAEQRKPGQAAPVWSKAGGQPGRRPASPLRLTTRGRVVVVAILIAPLLLTVSLLFRSQVDASSAPTAPRPYPTIVVQPGDTLWTIAGRVAPGRDPRAVIHQIREINGLSSASIQPGQRLAVPPR